MDANENQLDLTLDQFLGMGNFSLEEDKPETKSESDLEITLEPETTTEEEVKEDKPEDVVVETKEEIQLETTPNIYLELLKEKLNSGEWEDAVLENEDGTSVKLSELDNIDPETYKALVEDNKKHFDDKLKTDYVSIEGLNETQKALINIVKSGDLEKAKELFENPQQIQEPFQGYQDDNEAHQEQVLAWYFQKQGNSPKEVQALIKIAKEDFTLDVKANKIVEFQRNAFKENIKQQEEATLKARQEEEQNRKTYKKDIVNVFKEEQLSDTLIKKFSDVATKPTQDGSLEIDNIYEDWMKDPKKAAKLIHFMLDTEGFMKKETANIKKEVHKDVLRTVKIVRDTSKVADKSKKEESQTNGLTEIEL